VRAFGGLLVRKERWTLSWGAKFLALIAMIATFFGCVLVVYPFLAITSRELPDTLVAEGWMPTAYVAALATEFKAHDYDRIVLVRGITQGNSPYETGEFNAAYVVDALTKLGVPQERVRVVFFDVSETDRTYQSALAARRWIESENIPVRAINVATLGPHARRSRLLFQRAFGGNVAVGVIALSEPMYDTRHWWRSSAGVREVPSELLAYLYVRFFFSQR
jgi:hypothetical protein